MSTLLLAGCQPQPLLAYLKALGILRIVGEQCDPTVRGRWTAAGFELETALDLDALQARLLEDYTPSPIVAPWNGRSGFFPRDKPRANSEGLLSSFSVTESPRLADLREAIRVGEELHAIAAQGNWDVKEDKERSVAFCRNRMPDRAVVWIDTTAVLAEEGPAYPLVVGGAGGVLGSLDLTNNFLLHLDAVLQLGCLRSPPSTATVHRWLDDALSGRTTESGVAQKPGQFDPGRAGGVGRSRGDGGRSAWVNPWEMVLALEGSLLFAAGVARRSGRQGSRGVAAMPFSVRSSPVGSADAAQGERSSGEVWLPLWDRPATLSETKRLFSEARSNWDGSQAGTGLEFVKAVTSLGSERGLSAFNRIRLVQRLGQSNLAVASGYVAARPREGVPLLAPLDRWLRRVRRRSVPGAVSDALRRVDTEQFGAARYGGTTHLRGLLGAVTELEATIARSAVRNEVDPVVGLPAAAWVEALDDGTAEFSVAAGLASLRDTMPITWDRSERSPGPHSIASLVKPIVGGDDRRRWTSRSPLVEGLGVRSLVDVLAEVLAWRSRIARVQSPDGQESELSVAGVTPWFEWGRPIAANVVERFADDELDLGLIERSFRMMLLLDWEWSKGGELGARGAPGYGRCPAWSLLAPFYAAAPATAAVGRVQLRPQAGWARQLAAGHVGRVAGEAVQRLRVAQLTPRVTDPGSISTGANGPSVGAALLLRLSGSSVTQQLKASAYATTQEGNDR